MRISGGEAKGRALKFPPRSTQRPTTDFLREALFNLLGSPADQFFLDLFAGSGSVGLEAASRQAKEVTFVEKSKDLVGVVHENVSLCGYSGKCLVIHADIQSALRDLYGKKCRFDVIFADPPYNQGFIGKTLGALNEYPVLQEEGIIVFQHSVREQIKALPDRWSVADQRKYGDNLLTFLRVESS
ncbi:MAG: 16S rRNA (guanine(966)-N(2))-methyltransferase RsmD [Deltaproteobacteria bacterium HGW-Deltaproteobacteria-7]|jgi:16S rRNA (guanine966-N2)-methyltransferase|nr:MAG: 16S rRNA (guanine(966)-N(2))-methyltransferase RsmD [Deltaproteobacteria bacterium HGW-Deltaproteobacteria-7]PKN20938.1 MAG: 16S rRNA (guanine(966)-N(2))-methyltransferase RsmD [Deltaproteobacteria bacterium HGW-Deltaproteobacteria-6]